MAKLVAPLFSQEARGKAGSIIYNTYRGIATAKSFAAPVQPNTAAQINARSRMTDASRAWAVLNNDQRAAWEVYADTHLETDWTGKPKRLTGANWFCRCYTRSKLVGGSGVTTAPTNDAPTAPAITAIAYNSGSGGKIEVTYSTAPASGIVWVFYGLGPISDGRVPKIQLAAIQKQVTHSDTSPDDIYTAPSSGRYGVWYQAIDAATGLASGLSYAQVEPW